MWKVINLSGSPLQLALRRSFVLGLALLFIFAIPLSFTSLILCFDEDGAVHVEQVSSGVCVDEATKVVSIITSEENDCHGCTDLTLSAKSSKTIFQRSLHISDFAPLDLKPIYTAGVFKIAKYQYDDKTFLFRSHDLVRLSTIKILV